MNTIIASTWDTILQYFFRIFTALKTRKSIRSFRQEPLTKGRHSYLLWASTGIQRVEAGYEFRTAPSAGALYPIETYLLTPQELTQTRNSPESPLLGSWEESAPKK